MDKTRDLDAALSFVVGRIAEQARLSGEPLSEEQRFLLDNLPSTPASTHSLIPVHPEIVELVPRNINYERLCALAKEANLNDRETNPESLDWENGQESREAKRWLLSGDFNSLQEVFVPIGWGRELQENADLI